MGFALRFQFLQSVYQAAPPGQITEPEWPPHPVRAHCALVAAGWAMSEDDSLSRVLAALRWLENAGSPTIAFPADAVRRSSPTVYVPRNPTRQEMSAARGSLRRSDLKAFQRQFGRVDRTFPTIVVGDEPVWLAWPHIEPHRELRNVIHALAGYVSYLGSSRSPVACAAVDSRDAPAPTLVPVDGTGTYVLRVAGPGLTDELVANRYGRGSVAGAAQPYRHAWELGRHTEATAKPQLSGPFGRLVVLRRAEGFRLTLAHTSIVARALRNAVLANAGNGAPAILHGHGRNPHAAFLPLASVGNRYAGGEIRGFALAIPADATDEEEDAILAAVRRTERVAITREIVPWRVEHVPDPATVAEPDPDTALHTLEPGRWIGPSDNWATATPVVLDRHTRRGRRASAEDMVKLAFVNALLPEPASVEISKVPFLGGAVPVGVHAANGAPSGALWHVHVRFERPLRGPLIAGRGRYMGTGLFAPLPARPEERG